jgi:hypothetical protein
LTCISYRYILIDMKIINVLLLVMVCIPNVQSEETMFMDSDGRWVNSEGGNIYGDSRFNLKADPRFNLRADPKFNLKADPRFNLDADPRFNLRANPDFSILGDTRY